MQARKIYYKLIFKQKKNKPKNEYVEVYMLFHKKLKLTWKTKVLYKNNLYILYKFLLTFALQTSAPKLYTLCKDIKNHKNQQQQNILSLFFLGEF